MKIGVIGDVHFSTNSSIVREMGDLYSKRLEHCIKSINWAEEKTKDCDLIVYLGDFFDEAKLSALEISAFTEIKWNKKPHIIICGNHEMGRSDLQISSAHLFKLLPNFTFITEPTSLDGLLYFLPYSLNPNLDKYSGEKIVFSHNDIAGINYGGFTTTHGLDINEINMFFVNGHLHNGSVLKPGVINLGNFVGQNFSEDAFNYSHNLMILDSISLEYELIENPFSFNFYKISELKELAKIKDNAVLSITAKKEDLPKFREFLENNKKVLYSRILTEVEYEKVEIGKVDLSVNHLELFRDYISKTLGEEGVKEFGKI